MADVRFEDFAPRCKIRHDFADQIQVRYYHPNGEHFDTWVSGEEVLSRLRSEAAEQRLEGLRRLDWQAIRQAGQELPEQARNTLYRRLRDYLGDQVDESLGSNRIGGSLADAVRGETNDADDEKSWRAFLADAAFRAVVLELAWIDLEGSLPELPAEPEPDDWV